MDFNRHGVPGCSINDTYEHFIDTWRDVTLTDSSFTSILTLKGTVTLNGNDYYAVADLDPVTGEVMLLDLNFPEHRNDEWDTIEGIELQTCSARLLAACPSSTRPPISTRHAWSGRRRTWHSSFSKTFPAPFAGTKLDDALTPTVV